MDVLSPYKSEVMDNFAKHTEVSDRRSQANTMFAIDGDTMSPKRRKIWTQNILKNQSSPVNVVVALV
jgi:hypothetical protein